MLTSEERAAHQRDGIVVPAFRLPEDELAALGAAVGAVLAANPGKRPEKLVSAHIAEGGPEGVKGHATFMALARDPRILDMVAQVIGPDIILWGAHLFCKPAGDGQAVPWHQDGHYWPIRPLATVSVWVALDDSLPENGCLRVIPGSHAERRHYPHRQVDGSNLALDRALTPDSFEEGEARDVVLEAGQMSLHDVYLLHGSAANTSTRRRAGIALRYMPASSLFDREMTTPNTTPGLKTAFATRPIWLLRGEDRAGNDFRVGHA